LINREFRLGKGRLRITNPNNDTKKVKEVEKHFKDYSEGFPTLTKAYIFHCGITISCDVEV
jgi:hypothetical protein